MFNDLLEHSSAFEGKEMQQLLQKLLDGYGSPVQPRVTVLFACKCSVSLCACFSFSSSYM
jgi:hypothetical protein